MKRVVGMSYTLDLQEILCLYTHIYFLYMYASNFQIVSILIGKTDVDIPLVDKYKYYLIDQHEIILNLKKLSFLKWLQNICISL